MSKFGGLSLAQIIAQICEYMHDDYRDNPDSVLDENIIWNTAYICSCFIAQHTVDGHAGVNTDHTLNGLKIAQDIDYWERLDLVNQYIALYYGGVK